MRKFSVPLFILLFSAVCCFSQSNNNNLKKVEWILSGQDFNLNIKEEKIDAGNHKLEIARKSANETELLLIKKAEALYPKEVMGETPRTPPAGKKVFSPSVEDSPFWSLNSFDGVKIAKIVSTRALNYYQELSSAYRDNKNPTTINMSRTEFRYSANVVHYDKYEFQRETFENVNVVFMKMSWSQYCGGLCAMNFVREKFVVFNKDNEPMALFIDTESGAVVS